MEKSYIKYSRYENQREVFDNRMTRNLLEQERTRLQDNVDELQSELDLQEIKDPDVQTSLETQQNILQEGFYLYRIYKI